MTGLRFGHGSHTGRIRERNEDNYYFDPEIGLWVVADGMGGVKGGQIASWIVAREVVGEVKKGLDLRRAIAQAHRVVQDAANRGEGAVGMGSTVVALKTDGLRYEIAGVGDSRAYLWTGRLLQLTKDHSLLQELIDAGLIDQTQAQGHPARHIITQAVGSTEDGELMVDSLDGLLTVGDQLLLCTDGLTGEVPDEQIAAILAADGDEQSKVDKLIAAALKNGGSDNVTVILISASADLS